MGQWLQDPGFSPKSSWFNHDCGSSCALGRGTWPSCPSSSERSYMLLIFWLPSPMLFVFLFARYKINPNLKDRNLKRKLRPSGHNFILKHSALTPVIQQISKSSIIYKKDMANVKVKPFKKRLWLAFFALGNQIQGPLPQRSTSIWQQLTPLVKFNNARSLFNKQMT